MPSAPSIALPSASPPSALPGHMASLRQRIAALRRKYVTVTLMHGVLVVLGAAVAMVTGEMLLDWLVDLPWVVRLLVLLGGLGTAGWLVRQRLVQPWRGRPTEDAVALMIERAMPIFRGRYICSVQLARNTAGVAGSSAPGLVRALVAQTVALASGRPFNQVVSTRQLRKAIVRSLLGAALLAGAFTLAGASGWILLRRAFLSNEAVPTKTRVVDVTGDRIVATGDDLTIEAGAAGLIPSKPGRLIITEPSTRTRTEFPLNALSGQPARFARLVTSIQRPFDYQIRLGDGKSALFHVTTRARPSVSSLVAQQIYPAYTRMKPARRSLNDLSLLAGSRLRLQCRASVDVKAGSVRLAGNAPPPPIPMQLKNGRELTVELPIAGKDVTGFSISLVDSAGIETKDPTVYRIDVIPDLPPAVRITIPVRAEVLATTHAKLLIAFEANDDLGINKMFLRYKISGAQVEGQAETAAVEKSLEMDLANDQPRDLRRRYDWSIADLRPAPVPGTTIEFWLEATDANDVSGPGIGRSSHIVTRVVTDPEKLADLMNNVSDVIDGARDLSKGQSDLSQKLGTLITDKATTTPP